MKRIFYLLILSLVLFSGCSIFQKDSFEGEWQLRLTGSIDESFYLTVLSDNSFTTNKIINYSGRDFDVTVKGKIENDGKIEADIVVAGQAMGQIKGKMNYENGKGTWGANVLSGEWTSTKK